MTLWGNVAANSAQAPKMKDISPKGSANGSALFGNVTPGAFRPGLAVGVFGAADPSGANAAMPSAGWQIVTRGSGPIATLTINAGGTTYANTDLIKVSGGKVNAAGTLVTNSTGGLTSVTITTAGSGFINVASTTVAVTNATGGASAGSGATFVFTLGGRAGRVMAETLVAMGSLQ